MATITHLPDDVIIIILEIESIRVEDIINFKSTCKRFQQITLFQKFWEKKYYQSCPTAEKKYNREKQKKIFHQSDFKKRIKAGLYCIQMLKHYAFMMSENKVYDTDKEQLECLLHSIVENSMTYYFVWDEINRISAERPCKLFSNLTHEYNFEMIFYYLKQYRFIYKQMKFKNMPKTKSLLEKQLTIMAQYFQPHVSSAVKTWLDSITETVLSRLKNKYPAHSICSTTLEQFSFWRDNNIYDNFWNETESRQIMCILEEYIFSELEIHKLYQLLMMSELVAKYTEHIEVRFRMDLLAVTYHIVARRLGIHSVLTMRLNAAIGIIWKPNYNTNNLYNPEYFYVSDDSNLLYPSNIIRERIRDIELQQTPSNDIMGIEVMMSIFNVIYLHIHYFFTYEYEFLMEDIENINIEIEYKNITNTIEVRSNAVKEPLKRRTNDVKFAVGMIVTHTYKNTFSLDNHYGVIIGWHRGYDIKIEDKLKKTIMFPYLHKGDNFYHVCVCQQFSASAHQLHYIILTENNKICYVQQDQLSICPPKRINNVEIGRYFSSFEGTYYVPNESSRKHYPEDTAAIAKILAKQWFLLS